MTRIKVLAATNTRSMDTSTSPSLVHPDERPGTHVVIYDGDCQFCTRQAERLARWDPRAQLSFMSLHDSKIPDRYPHLRHDQLMEAMHVVSRHGCTYKGAAAFRYLASQLPRLRILLPVLHIPFSMPVWQWCYRQVAKRRYRWNRENTCQEDACSVHDR